ncbi:cytochrome b-c1 complex subunit 7-like [Harmonia axyridis]|uniref:cytochrome b-c1 complex subunit 7-like n=1 Tax=Harmonia axyridis TaxID=115357 RepID=UPI001E27991F|nr:cytochrome b-c1 complex subunit 7-like [Harmonia axyridis]
MSVTYIPKRCVSLAVQKIVYNLSGFKKYGLMRDDLLDEDRADVQEALKRLDEKILDERNYRLIRAAQLSLEKHILPKEQWTKFEDDKLYLTPIVKQVRKEWEEMEEWNKKY